MSDLLSCAEATKEWNKSVDAMLAKSDSKAFFGEVFECNQTIANLKSLLLLGLVLMADDGDFDGRAHLSYFADALTHMEPDFSSLSLAALSVLELTLMSAAKVVHGRRDDQQFNFEQVPKERERARVFGCILVGLLFQVFDEYQHFCTRKCSLMSFNRSVVMKSWEMLVSQDLLRPLDRGSKIQV